MKRAITLLLLLCVSRAACFAENPFPPDRFPVKVVGTHLQINDDSGRRFFLAGMVDNKPSSGQQLSRYDHAEMEAQIVNHIRMGATAMRWNAFLRGKDLRWDARGHVSGMCENAVANLKDGLDLAAKHGLVIQVVLSTAHFLQYGADGKKPANVERVKNNALMFEDEAATQAYIEHVIKPITQTIGVHPGLFGYCLINEASGMYFPGEVKTGTWSDVKVHLKDVQRWVNRVAAEIHTHQPGALCSVSGVASGIAQYSDEALIAAGGKSNGTMDTFTIMGNSNGAALANQLAIESRLPNIRNYVTAVSPLDVLQHDGRNFKAKGDDNSYEAVATPRTGARIMNISGTEDHLIPYAGGPSPAIPAKNGKLGFVAAEESIFLWAKAMGYRGGKLMKPSSTVGKLEVFSYLDGAIIHYKALGEGHGAAGAIDEVTLLRFLEAGR